MTEFIQCFKFRVVILASLYPLLVLVCSSHPSRCLFSHHSFFHVTHRKYLGALLQISH